MIKEKKVKSREQMEKSKEEKGEFLWKENFYEKT